MAVPQGSPQSLPSTRANSLENTEKWHFASTIEKSHQQDLDSGYHSRNLGVTWNNLTVKGLSADATVNENSISQFNAMTRMARRSKEMPTRTILENSHGCVKPGEMLLVLGRPGSGCTTLLKMLSNKRAGYSSIDGDVWFGSMNHQEAENYRGQIIMNSEEETFYPTLSVGDTINCATRSKVPSHLPNGAPSKNIYSSETTDFLLNSLGISHTAHTKVGNEHVRGVSGGERKRVSILECLASRASVYCWDNSTRGLDVINVLEWARGICLMTDVYGLSTIVTLYQVGNGIFDLFDKVFVLDEGKQIFYGPRD
ncbi:unnamed protein product [Penicillium salamii]|nr:unnamed protein product [Penicillium salamii]